jgi:hypothetical protein
MTDWCRAARHALYFGTAIREMQIMTRPSHDIGVVLVRPAADNDVRVT